MLPVIVAVLALGLAVYTVLDVLRTPPGAVRVLPKPVWALLCLVPVAGGLAWLALGRARPTGRVAPPAAPLSPDDDEDFLRELRRRADEQRRRDGGDGAAA